MPDQLSFLIVEADCRARERLTKWFLRGGHAVTAVCHPRQALEAATIRSFDVALLDQPVPERDSFHLISRLRGLVRDLFVVLFSRDPEGVTSEDAIRLGASAFLYLPCSLQQVDAIVQRAMSAAPSHTMPSSTLPQGRPLHCRVSDSSIMATKS